MNIYLYEQKAQRKSAVIWTCSLIGLAALYLSLYGGIVEDAEGFKELLGNYPVTVREMLGINLDYIATIVGFYSMIFSFILLCGTIQAMNLGVSILSKESRERTADFLLVKPVSRASIIHAKLLAAFTTLVTTDAIFLAVSVSLANIFKTGDFDNKRFLLINLTMFFTQLIFLAIGLVISVFFNKIKNVLPISLGVVFGFYLAGAIIASGKDEEALRFISPFKYFDISYIMKNAGYETPYLILGAVITVTAIIASYFIYIRKDIHAVS
jgi:ABC-2 type transport system permease protein